MSWVLSFLFAASWLSGFLVGRYRQKKACPSPKPPAETWEYLGQSQYHYNKPKSAEHAVTFHVRFFGSGPHYEKRKVEWNAVYDGPQYKLHLTQEVLENHNEYARQVPRWLAGDNLFRPIELPSDGLKDYAKKEYSQEYDYTNRKWVSVDRPKEDPKLPDKPPEDVVDVLMKEHENGKA